MTGCYAQRVGMHVNPRDGQVLRPISPYGLNPNEQTIAESLRRAGYATGIVGKWHLGDQPAFLPTRHGFDMFFGIPYSDDMTRETGQRIGDRMDGSRWPDLPLMRNETVIEAPVNRDLLTRRCTEQALAFIEAHQQEPFFLYFPQPMPGSTRAPFASPEFKGKSRNGPWGDAIEEIDWSTGKVLDKLVELKLDRHTLVIWTSDNGAPMAPNMDSPTRGTNKPLFGRGYTTAEGAFRVPTLMWWPGHVPAQSTCQEFATTMDLMPTFVQLATGDGVKIGAVDGHDIAPLILGQKDAKSPYESFCYYYQDQLQAIRSGPWKLFLPLKTFTRHPHFRQGQAPHPLLFNVVEDVHCRRDVAAQNPDIVARLSKFGDAWRQDLGDRGQRGNGQRSAGFLGSDTPPVPLLKTSAASK